MDNIFKDLEGLGFKNISDADLFKDETKKKSIEKKEKVKASTTQMYIYQRKVDCPICKHSFQTSTVRTGRVRFQGTELDLRPLYMGFDPIPYEVTVCNYCGYAAINKYFKTVSDAKKRAIIENITRNYIGHKYNEILTYEEAVERYKLVLLNSAVGGDGNGIKAYICLKISWLYRGWQESIKASENQNEALLKKLKTYEIVFVEKAYEGFKLAYSNETLPIMGIDDMTMEYIIAELARRLGDVRIAKQWLGKVIGHPDVSKRLRDKVYDVKELINEHIKQVEKKSQPS
ncbi:DUF2225 domain-containing protein [Vallitaleaceae bacterium 9-2]